MTLMFVLGVARIRLRKGSTPDRLALVLDPMIEQDTGVSKVHQRRRVDYWPVCQRRPRTYRGQGIVKIVVSRFIHNRRGVRRDKRSFLSGRQSAIQCSKFVHSAYINNNNGG